MEQPEGRARRLGMQDGGSDGRNTIRVKDLAYLFLVSLDPSMYLLSGKVRYGKGKGLLERG